jgi:hypothetical protein
MHGMFNRFVLNTPDSHLNYSDSEQRRNRSRMVLGLLSRPGLRAGSVALKRQPPGKLDVAWQAYIPVPLAERLIAEARVKDLLIRPRDRT